MKRFKIHIPVKGLYVIVLCSKRCKSCNLLLPSLEKFKARDFIKFKEINSIDNSQIAQELNIDTIPALIFFKNGKLLEKDFKVYGETFVNRGVMIGAFNELILRDLIAQM